MYLLKVPTFMSIEPHAWDHKTFQPPTTDHHSTKTPSSTFSAYNTALATIRWRHSPSDPSQLQSNARINRWSDGSLTLQLASDPATQYEIDGNALAPPQRNPVKPTPTSIRTVGNKGGRHGAAAGLEERYSQSKDGFTYLIRPHVESGSMIVTQKITAGLSIKQSGLVEDDAIERLQASLAAASNASKVNGASGISLVQTDEDPELAKTRALKAVQDAEKMKKKTQNAIDREAARSNRVLGGRGLGSSRYSGLNVGMLEDDEEGGGGRQGPSPGKGRSRQRRRRNSEYSEDEDFGTKRFREDEYDEEDDFVAPSDEEEVVEDDEDPDDGIVEEPRHRRDRTPKREREVEIDDDEADAPGEEDEEEVQMARTKRRRVVEEDEDEE